jgi:hypothetical protein
MSQITHKEGAFDTSNQFVSRHVQTVARSKSKRISGPVLDAAIGLLVRISMGQNKRKQTASGLCFLLNAGEYGFQRHSNWPKPAFAKRRCFHTRTHARHDQPVINSYTTYVSTVHWYSATLHVGAATTPARSTDYGIGRFESPLGPLLGFPNFGASSHFPHLQTTIPPRTTTGSFQTPYKFIVHQSSCRLQYKLHKTRTVHILSVSSSYFSSSIHFIFQQCIKFLCTQLAGSQDPFFHNFREECLLLYQVQEDSFTHTTHTDNRTGYCIP